MLYKTGAPKVRGLFEDRKLLVASFYQVPGQACFVPTDTSSVTNCLPGVFFLFLTFFKRKSVFRRIFIEGPGEGFFCPNRYIKCDELPGGFFLIFNPLLKTPAG